MASNPEEVRRAAMVELAKRELARRQGVAPEKRASFMQGIKNSAANLYRGATGMAALPFDALAGGYNAMQGDDGYYVTVNGQKEWRSGKIPTMTEQNEAGLSSLGVTPDEGPVAETIGAVTRGLGSAAFGMGLGGALSQSANQATRGVGAALASRPGTQLVAGAASGGASDVARQQGAGPFGQVAAGIGAGLAAGLAMPRDVPAPPVRPPNAAASSSATASATPGVAASSTTIAANPTARVTGGGFNPGTVGDDASSGLNGPMRDLANRGREIGMRLTPGQATGSRALQQFEAKLESQPMTSGPFNTLKASNQTLLNRLWARQIGVSSDTLDDSTMGRALIEMEGGFQQAADDVVRPIEPRGFLGFVSKAQADARGLVRGDVTNHPLFEDTIKFARDGGATGEQLHSLTSKIGRAAYKEMSTPSGDRDMGFALYQLKDYVDDLLVQGMAPERVARFQAARGNYRNLMLLTQRTGVVNPSSGNVQGRSLANVLQQRDRRGFTFGGNQSPAYDAARFAQAFAPIVGDSGTATRSSVPGLTEMVVGIPFNLATRAYTSSPAVNLSVKADAAARSAENYARGLARAPTAADVPASVITSQIDRRRRMAERLQGSR